jgi:hypothetical protein
LWSYDRNRFLLLNKQNLSRICVSGPTRLSFDGSGYKLRVCELNPKLLQMPLKKTKQNPFFSKL